MRKLQCLNGTHLKLLAMALMLCDHMWGTGVLGYDWLTLIGRMAFPIFAFQIAEGCALTHNMKGYLQRMLIFALISEIPYNYMMGGGPFDPFEQNVMWTFLLAMLLIYWLQLRWEKDPSPRRRLLDAAAALLMGFLAGTIGMVDYFGFGVVTVLIFWLTRDFKWGWAVQLLSLGYINCVLMGGRSYILHLGGQEIWIPQQGFAMLAFLPIFLYNGKKGPGGKFLHWFGYAFYPLHIAILVAIAFRMS